jgi:hypothetical protein
MVVSSTAAGDAADDPYGVGPFRGRCAFCRAPSPLTREHAWPRWLCETLKQRGPFRATIGDRQWQTSSIDLVARAVCRDCNNGWLAELETATLPVLRPLVTSDGPEAVPSVLSADDQWLLAAWAAKTLLTHEAVRPARVIPDGEFWTFYERRRPVGNQLIFLSAYSGRRWAARSWREPLHRTGSDGRLSAQPIGYTATLLAGGALFRLVRCEPAGTPIAVDQSISTTAVVLWPPIGQPLSWPPSIGVNDTAVDNFHATSGVA